MDLDSENVAKAAIVSAEFACRNKGKVLPAEMESRLCVAGTGCVFTDDTQTSSSCVAETGFGGFCGGAGQGPCKAGSQCLNASPNPPFAFFCFTDEALGDPCGPGKGLCGEGVSCVFDDASETSSTCIADGTSGVACGGFGQAVCADNFSCVNGVCGETSLFGGDCSSDNACLEGLSCLGNSCQ